jgi:hypothetical protein
MVRRRARPISAGPDQASPADVGLDQTQPADLAKLKRYFAEARDLTFVARTNSLMAQDYYDSDQYTPEEKKALNERHQPPVIVNRRSTMAGTSWGSTSWR